MGAVKNPNPLRGPAPIGMWQREAIHAFADHVATEIRSSVKQRRIEDHNKLPEPERLPKRRWWGLW